MMHFGNRDKLNSQQQQQQQQQLSILLPHVV